MDKVEEINEEHENIQEDENKNTRKSIITKKSKTYIN